MKFEYMYNDFLNVEYKYKSVSSSMIKLGLNSKLSINNSVFDSITEGRSIYLFIYIYISKIYLYR